MKGSTVFMIAFALTFYSTGAAFIESFVNYSSWHLIGPAEFSASISSSRHAFSRSWSYPRRSARCFRFSCSGFGRRRYPYGRYGW